MNRSLACLVFCVMVLGISCGVDPLAGDDEVVSIEDHLWAQQEFAQIGLIIQEEALAHDFFQEVGEFNAIASPGAKVKIEESNDQFHWTHDFKGGQLGRDGRTRAGKLVGTLTTPFNQEGSLLVLKGENYIVTALDGEAYSFTFELSIQYAGLTANQEEWYVLSIQEVKIALNGEEILWKFSGDLFRSEENGQMSLAFSGQGEGTASNEAFFLAEIEQTCFQRIDCEYLQDGQIRLSLDGRNDRVAIFVKEACQAEVNVNIASFSRQIKLR